jgi:hypothetical protein
MASINKIFIQTNDERIELIGAEKEAFLEDRKQIAAFEAQILKQQEAQKELKKSAYTKLGLTEEEINAIL